MNNETPAGSTGSVDATIKAVASLVKEVPIYDDAIQPVAKETGKALQTVGRAVNAALMPVKGLVWGFEKIEDFVYTKVAKKLENTPVDKICTPDPSVAGPALESLKYTGHKESLSELYANLLASAMDLDTAKTAHPGFVEIIKNLSPDEAKILKYMLKAKSIPLIDIKRVLLKDSGGEIKVQELVSTLGIDAQCEHSDLTGAYLVNLERLGLIDIRRDAYITKSDAYDLILNNQSVKNSLQNQTQGDECKGDFDKYYAKPSLLGAQFGSACVVSRD